MSFSRNDYEYMRADALPNWLEEFVNTELKKGGNFDDIKNLFKVKEDKYGVEARVQELRERIGLDAILKQSDQEKTASLKASLEFGDEPTQPEAKNIRKHQELFTKVMRVYEEAPDFKTALDAEYAAAKETELDLTLTKYVDRMVTRWVNEMPADDKLPGGLADGKPDSDFDKKQIEKGVEIEKEHTPDKDIRKEIAKDHLVEHDKYYNFLDKMETEMKKDKKSKAEIINTLVSLANALEEEKDFVGANIIDKHIKRVAKEVKEEATLPKMFEKLPKVKIFIDNLCKAREGHIDFPAVLKMLQDERKEKVDVYDDDLRGYIKKRLKEETKEIPDSGDERAGMNYTVFVVTEGDDENNEIFHSPAPKK